MNFKDENPEHLEFNDGVGDLLREKTTPKFNWTKTIGILIGLIIAILLGLLLAFYIGKLLLKSNPSGPNTAPQENTVPLPTFEDPKSEEIPEKSKETFAKKEIPHNKKPKPKNQKNAPPIPNKTPKIMAQESPKKNLSYKVIEGKYTTDDEAFNAKQSLAKKGIPYYSWKDPNGITYIQLGAYKTQQKATLQIQTLKSKGIEATLITLP